MFHCLEINHTATHIVSQVEMVSANMGSLVMSLPATSSSDNITTQVSLFSIFNTVSRLSVGSLADFLSPLPSYLPSGIWSFTRKRRASRMLFLTAVCCMLLLTYVWCVIGIRSQEALWSLRWVVFLTQRQTLMIIQYI